MACIALFLLAYQWLMRRRDEHAVPRISSWWKPLGLALEMGTDWQRFLDTTTAKYGPVFKCRIAFEDVTFLNDHRLSTHVMRQSKTFRFDLAFPAKAEKLFKVCPLHSSMTRADKYTHTDQRPGGNAL